MRRVERRGEKLKDEEEGQTETVKEERMKRARSCEVKGGGTRQTLSFEPPGGFYIHWLLSSPEPNCSATCLTLMTSSVRDTAGADERRRAGRFVCCAVWEN